MSKLKKYIIILIGFLIVLLGLAINSEAARTQFLNSFIVLATRGDIYCTQHSREIFNMGCTYTLVGNYDIKGNIARNNQTGATVEHTDNGIMAYILHQEQVKPSTISSGGYAHLSRYPAQVALWMHQANWYNTVGQHIGIKAGVLEGTSDYSSAHRFGTYDDAQNIVSAGKKYAKEISGSNVSSNTDQSKIVVEPYEKNGEDYVRVGPFNFTFAGSFSKIELKGNDNISIPISAYEKYNGSQIEEISSPVKDQNFYISFKIPENVYKIAGIYVYTTRSVLCVNFELWECLSYNTQSFLQRGNRWTENQDFNGHWDLDINLFGKFDLLKVDPDALNEDGELGKPLKDVGFTLQMVSGVKEGYYVSYDEDGDAVYTEEPVTIMTDEDGKIFIDQMWMGDYELIEVVNPHFGYEDLPIVLGTYTVDPGATAKVTANNKRKYIKIRGFAWEEKADGKNSTKDYIWTDGAEDRRLENVTVRLISANGEILDEVITDANGEYVFGNYDENENAIQLEIEDVIGAYIEFEYNGMSYQSIEVNPQFKAVEETDSVGTKITKYTGETNVATDEALREDFNNRYATIDERSEDNTGDIKYNDAYNPNGEKTHEIKYTYDAQNHRSTVIYGDDVKYGYEGQTYPISGVYDQYTLQAVTEIKETNALCTDLTPETIRRDSVEEIGGLNLGVEERIMPDLAVVEDVEKVDISLNGYTHTYQYAQRFEDPENYAGGDPFNASVKFASKYIENSYSREVYSSDVKYNSLNDRALNIFITYKIEIRNESSTVNTNVKTLVNYYDERYENVVVRNDDETVTDENGNIGNIIQSEEDNNYQTDNAMNKQDIYTDYTIAPGQTRYIRITYQLNNDAINALLNGELTLESVTEVTSYSSYSDENYSIPYAGIDVDSAVGTVEPVLQDNKISIVDTIEDDTDKAPSLIIKLKDARMIEGTVWEDGADPNLLNNIGYDKERKGNGKYETTENVVEKVKVELLTVSGSGENITYDTAYLYPTDQETGVVAETYTAPNGTYKFEGVIPDNYAIRYTYGDNSYIYRSDGTQVLDEDGNPKTADANNYKSTIYRGGSKEDAEAIKNNLYWYRGETSDVEGVERLSDAKDNEDIIAQRMTEVMDSNLVDINYGSVIASEAFTEIDAYTEKFDIKLEYDVNLDNISQYGADLKFDFNQIDFGIIERPKQSIQIDKKVSNIQIMLANGNDLINGNPQEETLSGVRVVDDDVYIEIDNEIIQGSTLTVTYGITVDNTACEIDYNNEDYYIYGIVPEDHADWKIATVVDMFDYLPEDLVFQTENSDNASWELINITPDMENELLAKAVYERVNGLSNIVHLTEEGSRTFDLEPGQTATENIIVSRQLATSSDDLTYENDVEVIRLTGRAPIDSTPGNYDPVENETYDPGDPTNSPEYPNGGTFTGENEPDDDKVEVTITPPTGEFRQYLLYGIIGISILVIVGVGIVIIKKKVL